MKKLVSLLLCALMVMSLFATAFAASTAPAASAELEAETLIGCNHDFQGYHDENESSITNFGDGTCGYRVVSVGRCRLCGEIDTQPTSRKANVYSHTFKLYHATCNGYDQTWYYRCARGCGAIDTETRRCPKAGHGGSCQWLPI